jgi:RNA polymerase sigma factor (sigma-70 family)
MSTGKRFRKVAIMRYTQIAAVSDVRQGAAELGTLSGVSDSQLLARFAAHRDELAEIAFAALVHRHGRMVLRVCEQVLGDRHAAEDAFQVTFLILARKAGSIGRPELVGHWLHGVALRTAREARMRAARRRRRECARTENDPPEPMTDCRPELALVCREELEALHEAVAGLPERYRVPLVLCELEGLSYHDAALRMGCPVGTIGVRLSRARQRLREQLLRRGVAPSAALLAALLGADASLAGVPAVLVEATVQGAMALAAGKAATSGVVSATVVALAEAVERTMALARLKMALGLVFAAGTAATVALVGPGVQIAVPPVSDLGGIQATSTSPPASIAGAPERGRSELVDEPARLGNAAALARTAAPAPDPTRGAPGTTDRIIREVDSHTNPKGSAPNFPTLPPGGLKPNLPIALASLRQPLRDERMRGEALFAKEWVPNDRGAPGGDGLGPVFNESSCVACHGLGAPGGAGPGTKNVVLVTATPLGNGSLQDLDRVHPGFHGTRSVVLHRHGTDPEYESWRERFYNSTPAEKPDPSTNSGEDAVSSRIGAIKKQAELDRRILAGTTSLPAVKGFSLSLSERNTPALFGMGRIDAIPAEVLVATAARQPAAVRGRVNRSPEGRVSRFGWKAQLASLHEFVRSACANELGLEVPGHPQAISPLAPTAKAKGLDMTETDCDALVAYIRALPAPVVIDPSGPHGAREMEEGRRLFVAVGCATCHMPSLGDVQGIYSDLLLHDMGPSLSDSGTYYGFQSPDPFVGPTAQEWRTPPLWGYRDSGPYLHDGRARNLEQTVALHEGQARESAHRFFALTSQDRFQIEAFLKSLVAPSLAAVSGMVLAADLETRVLHDEQGEPEIAVRRRRDEAAARGEHEWRELQRRHREREAEVQRRRLAQEAAVHARAQMAFARALDKAGHTTGALNYYRAIARESPDSADGQYAATRIAALSAASEVRIERMP